MKIGVVGGGVVGQATARTYMEQHEVRVCDVHRERSTHNLLETIDGADICFVCLPSPQKVGSLVCDMSVIDRFFSFQGWNRETQDKLREVNWVLRSTVPIGTTRRLSMEHNLPHIVHSPEFLTARCANTDAQIPARNIIGDLDERKRCGDKLWALYHGRFPGVAIHSMTSDESEAVKLFQNGFFAVKVAYFNEINQLAARLGLDWERVRAGMLSDGRIAHSHTQVPGPDGQYGFGGSCLPKDLANLVTHIDQDVNLAEGSVAWAAYLRNTNDRQRKE